MHPKLTNISISNIDELRQLIVSSMETIFNSYQILDLEAPLPGKPILLLNQDNCLVIVSFDLHDTGDALLNGLRASEKLLCEAEIFKKLYPILQKKNLNLRERIKLLLLAPADKTNELGHDLFNEQVSIYTFRGIGVNGETILMIEPEIPLSSPSYNNKRKSDPELDREAMIDTSFDKGPELSTDKLSTDEVLFFKQL